MQLTKQHLLRRASDLMIELLEKKDVKETIIAKKTATTFSHTVMKLQNLEKNSIISREKKGREVLINLTIKGKAIAEHLKKIYKILGYIKEEEKIEVVKVEN